MWDGWKYLDESVLMRRPKHLLTQSSNHLGLKSCSKYSKNHINYRSLSGLGGPLLRPPGPAGSLGPSSGSIGTRREPKGGSSSASSAAVRKNHIKKPLNAFMLYMKEMRPKVVAECTLKESAAINQILGRKVFNLFPVTLSQPNCQ